MLIERKERETEKGGGEEEEGGGEGGGEEVGRKRGRKEGRSKGGKKGRSSTTSWVSGSFFLRVGVRAQTRRGAEKEVQAGGGRGGRRGREGCESWLEIGKKVSLSGDSQCSLPAHPALGKDPETCGAEPRG